jgi:hypothetical protein
MKGSIATCSCVRNGIRNMQASSQPAGTAHIVAYAQRLVGSLHAHRVVKAAVECGVRCELRFICSEGGMHDALVPVGRAGWSAWVVTSTLHEL